MQGSEVKFTIQHPDDDADLVAEYGWDHAVGFFVTLHGLPGTHEYDATHPGYGYLHGALQYLACAGFFSTDELHAALDLLIHRTPDQMPPRLRRIADVVVNFKTASDQ